MCKHVLNAQVSIRTWCCKRWLDCPQCHAEVADHPLKKRDELIMACKKCKKVFRKNMSEFEESDEYCPACDNHYVIDAIRNEEKVLEAAGAEVVQVAVDADKMDARTKAKISDAEMDELLKQAMEEEH